MENRKPTPSEIVGGMIWNYGIENIRMSIEGIPNLWKANEYLNEGWRILLSHSHPSSVDPGPVLRTAIDFLDYSELGYPASSKLVDKRMLLYGLTIDYLKAEDLIHHVWPIVQDNDPVKLRQILKQKAAKLRNISIEDIKNMPQKFQDMVGGLRDKQDNLNQGTQDSISSFNLNRDQIDAAVEFLRSTPSAILPFADESTRNVQTHIFRKNRGLKKTKNLGAYLFGSAPDKIMLLPIAMEGSENYHQKGQKLPPNPLARVKVHVGIPRSFDEVARVAEYLNPGKVNIRSFADAMKLEQAALLPPVYYGYYQTMMEKIMQDTNISYPLWALDTIRSQVHDEGVPLKYRRYFQRLERLGSIK